MQLKGRVAELDAVMEELRAQSQIQIPGFDIEELQARPEPGDRGRVASHKRSLARCAVGGATALQFGRYRQVVEPVIT